VCYAFRIIDVLEKYAMKQRTKLFCGLLFLIPLFITLSSCTQHTIPRYIENPVEENLSPMQRSLLGDIEKTGIQIIKQGMRFTFVIPTDCFFTMDTHELKPHREIALDRLAQFINSYAAYFEHPHVKVSGYTDKVWLSPARDLLSIHYADTIAEYLREDGINSSIISVRGCGAKHPIASNHYPMGTAFNRRVEVMVY